MSSEIPAGRDLARLLPQSTFTRFMLAAVLVFFLASSSGLLVAYMVGRTMVRSMYDEACADTLRSVSDLVARHHIGQEQFHNGQLESTMQTLVAALDGASTFLTALDSNPPPGDSETASRIFLDYIAYARSLSQVELMVVGENGIIAVHPDSSLVGMRLEELPSIGPAAGEMLIDLASRLPGETVYSSYSPDHGAGEDETLFIAARHLKPWGLNVFALLSDRPMRNRLALHWGSTLDELRARIREIIIARSGFVFIFDQDCRIISHPILQDYDADRDSETNSEAFLCRELQDAALRPWGENRLEYRWNRPDQPGRFDFRQVSWVTVEPTTGWYLAANAYVRDMEAELPHFVGRIFFPSLLLIVATIILLALLLRRLLTPIRTLTAACHKVAAGDFTVTTDEVESGDVGVLTRSFNKMIQAIGDLRRTDALHREELHDLNVNLERMVALRTRALERKARKLEEANIRLQELDQLKSDFLSSVSHELRTPMTSILGFSKLIRRLFNEHILDRFAGERKLMAVGRRIDHNLEIIAKEGDRLTRLINDVLDLSRIQTGRMPWHETTVHLQELIDEALRVLNPLVERRQAPAIHVNIASDIPSIQADHDRMLQVVINLLDNAIKFTPSGDIFITGCCRQDHIQLRFKDTGPGIPRSDLLTIFESFHQAMNRTDNSKPQGTGLGLAICRAVLIRYGGFIWAESAPGRGTDVFLEFPCKTQQESSSSMNI